ncbi:hypothetical protein [Bacillus horti]|uniref:LXG domain-containing protein n=1 Tax=Caldalkalibacillus horti TaxID=77523 RepID=A0ABT9W0I4_9BACI|nr:hypothetical protein [Bacillus horti]MDQ0166610.1 hypothetical protein [Bacillus horti]
MSNTMADGQATSKLGVQIITEFQKSIQNIQQLSPVAQQPNGTSNPFRLNLQAYLLSELDKISTQFFTNIKKQLDSHIKQLQSQMQHRNVLTRDAIQNAISQSLGVNQQSGMSQDAALLGLLESLKPQIDLLINGISDLSQNLKGFPGMFTQIVSEIKSNMNTTGSSSAMGGLGSSSRTMDKNGARSTIENVLSSQGGMDMRGKGLSAISLGDTIFGAIDLADDFKNATNRSNQNTSKGKGFLATVGKIGRTVGKVFKPISLAFAAGDVISSIGALIDDSKLSEEEKNLRNQQNSLEAYKLGSNPINKYIGKNLGNDLYNVASFLFNGDANARTGQREIWEANKEYSDWVKEQYGQEAYKQLPIFKKDAYLEEFLNSTGKYDELAQAEQDLFNSRAVQEKEELINNQKMKEQAEKAIREKESLLIQNGDYSSFSEQALGEHLDRQLNELNDNYDLKELESILSGHKMYSTEFFNVLRQRLEEEQELIDQSLENLDGLDDYDSIKDKYEKRKSELELALNNLKREEAITQANVNINDAQHNKTMQDLMGSLTMNRNSTEYIDLQRSTTSEMITALKYNLDNLKKQAILDPDDELKGQIQNLEQMILGAEVSLKDLSLQRITGYRSELQQFNSEQELELMRTKVAHGSSNYPAIKQFTRAQNQELISKLNEYQAKLESELSRETDSEKREAYERELVNLEKQSLQVQLGLLDEVRGQGGTFNLPDGFRAMSEFDYMMSRGTHSSYALSAGDMNVNVILPNINNWSTPDQIRMAAEQFGRGLANSRQNSLRFMQAGGPYNYRTL